MTRPEDGAREENGGERREAGERLGDRMSEVDKRAFAELIREMYVASRDVDDEVEECLRLGREAADNPEAKESSASIIERVFEKLQERGELNAGEDPRALARKIVYGDEEQESLNG